MAFGRLRLLSANAVKQQKDFSPIKYKSGRMEVCENYQKKQILNLKLGESFIKMKPSISIYSRPVVRA